MPYPNIIEESNINFSQESFDSIDPIKKKERETILKRLALWNNLNTRKLKQKAHKLGKKRAFY